MSYNSRSSLDVTGVLGSLSRGSQLIDMTEEPYSLEGGRPIPSLLTKTIKDVENYALHGSPISISALVSRLVPQLMFRLLIQILGKTSRHLLTQRRT